MSPTRQVFKFIMLDSNEWICRSCKVLTKTLSAAKMSHENELKKV